MLVKKKKNKKVEENLGNQVSIGNFVVRFKSIDSIIPNENISYYKCIDDNL